MIQCNTCNHLTVCKRMNLGSFKNVINKMCLQIIVAQLTGAVEYTDCFSAVG